MRRIACILLVMLMVSVVLAGCGRPRQQPPGAAQPAGPAAGPADGGTSGPGSVTQEDLDKLKADIENLNAEDLGGLTED